MTSRLALALVASLLLAAAGSAHAQGATCYMAKQGAKVRWRGLAGGGSGGWRCRRVGGEGKHRKQRVGGGRRQRASARLLGSQVLSFHIMAQIRTAADVCSPSKGSLAPGDIVRRRAGGGGGGGGARARARAACCCCLHAACVEVITHQPSPSEQPHCPLTTTAPQGSCPRPFSCALFTLCGLP